ncbi:MAG: hypothetical protein AB3N33_00585 [Puniceicoccaceae bacterium]
MIQLQKQFHSFRFLAPMALALLPVVVAAQDFPKDDLVLHLDAGSIAGIADGAPLTTGWADLSATGGTAISGTPPTYVADAGSGYPAVRFNGVDQYLDAAVSTGTEISLFIVFAHQRAGSPTNYRDILITGNGGGTNLSLASSRSSASAPDYPSFNSSTGSGVSVGLWVNGLDTADATGDLFRGRFYVGSAVYTEVPAESSLRIGARGTGGFNAGRNDIREILVYDRALSDAERESVQRYLGLKYDIELVWRPLDYPVEDWAHPLGSQQFGTQYSFGESGIRTLDYARSTLRQGSRVVKFRLSNKYANTDGFTAVAGIDTLIELVRDQPEVKTILDMPMTDYVFWVSTFAVPSWQNQLDTNGLKPAKATAIYNEVKAMVAYLLTTYSGTGKRFYIGNWEGDWMLSGNFRDDPNTIPANRIQGMIDWANIRQKAVDDAKTETPHSDVDVWFYLEMNKADWMRQNLPCVANSIIPAMPKLDMISISSYSVHKDGGEPASNTRIHSDLDRVQALIDAKPDASIPGSRLMIGEYGWTYSSTKYNNSLEAFAEDHITTARSFFSWQGGTLRFILQWQFFNEATNDNGSSKEMSQIGPANDLRPLYHMHENLNRSMRRWVDDYLLRTGSLPSERAYADQADHFLATVSLAEYQPLLSTTTYEQWRDFQFIDAAEAADTAISGPNADPYGTGLANLIRYGLGMGKFGSESARLPHLRWNGGSLSYAVPVDPAKTDLRWLIEADSSLDQWNLNLFDSATDSPVLDDGWLEVSADGLIDPGDPVFYRLQLQLIP